MDEGGTGVRLDIPNLLLEAHRRWLRPAEICEILRNYQKFHLSPEAPSNPASGSVFLFDRKVLRYFRKDGHNWRKKKDGKTVREAHEKLKVGSIDMLHCYYAHGEHNENFQRRSYWLLEQDLMHIVFVHYLEVQGVKSSMSYAIKGDGTASNSGNNVSTSSSFRGASPTSPLSSAHDDAQSEGNLLASSDYRLYLEPPLSYDPPFNAAGNGSVYAMTDEPHVQGGGGEGIDMSLLTGVAEPVFFPEKSLPFDVEGPCYKYLDQKAQCTNRKLLLSDKGFGDDPMQNFDNSMEDVRNENFSFSLKKTPLGGLQSEEGLKKVDSFSRWMDKELGEADGLATQPSSGISWSIIGSEYETKMPLQLHVDADTLSPISQDQLYSITDFSPPWAYSNQETKVLIYGIFLRGEVDLSKSRWSIMFGQVEVPAEVLGDGILCCRAPLHDPGLLPFYVTCSNRSACSEIREFEYRSRIIPSSGSVDLDEGTVTLAHLYQRFEMVLHMEPHGTPLSTSADDFDVETITLKIMSLQEEESLTFEKDTLRRGELLLEKKLKRMFFSWCLDRVAEGGTGLMAFDEGGQTALHLAATLGFIWAFQPFIESGVRIDFRDANGWTALHWAAYYGREDAVAALVSLGAGPGLLTDPSAKYPLGRTPADLASSNGHKGISGFLAETSLTIHLSTLTVNVDGATEGNAYRTLSDHVAAPIMEENSPDKLSLNDSLTAVCNATQAAARIHQIFRLQSFRRKQINELESNEVLDSDEQAVSLVAGKGSRYGNSYGRANAAAIQIQKKYRGWKKRKEFLLIRQKVVKIQAHVRGHQVRRNYKPIVWSVGILEKVILRWRRKGRGLRGYRQTSVEAESECSSKPDDDYDLLKQGRKQTEERMQKALERVKSMARYPEARAQYRRLLSTTESLRETKDLMIPDTLDDLRNFEDEHLMEVASMLDDETFISLTFQ